MDRYVVERNSCRCHPETCNCEGWVITKNGDFWCRIFNKDKAEIIACALNEMSARIYREDNP